MMDEKTIKEKFKKFYPWACRIQIGERYDGPEVDAYDEQGAYLGTWWYNGETFEKEEEYYFAEIDINFSKVMPTLGIYYTKKDPSEHIDEDEIIKKVRENYMKEIKAKIMELVTSDNLSLSVGSLDGWPAPYSQIKDRLIEI